MGGDSVTQIGTELIDAANAFKLAVEATNNAYRKRGAAERALNQARLEADEADKRLNEAKCKLLAASGAEQLDPFGSWFDLNSLSTP
jgi:hypothetical protein